MDEKQLKHQFITIISESHPGLTFEEYRDSCIFILFYHYLCLRCKERLDDEYKLHTMVRIAIRGKLQMNSFLQFMEHAGRQLHALCPEFHLSEFSFYKQLLEVNTLEKQKSYARFFRKLIKKMHEWEDHELLYACYPACFEELLLEFSKMKKETCIPDAIVALYQLFMEENRLKKEMRIVQPEFRYGTLLHTLLEPFEDSYLYGYESQEDYIEILQMLCFMKNMPKERQHLMLYRDWLAKKHEMEPVDTVCIHMPNGVEPGIYMTKEEENEEILHLLKQRSKGELPFLLSAFPMLREDGSIIAILPSALLYREGREIQMREYLVDTLNCLDTIILLPEMLFPSQGQQEVFLYIKKNRKTENVMFFDCSQMESFEEDTLKDIRKAWRGRKNIPGFCSRVEREEIRDNHYNLNLPRYIKKPVGLQAIDLQEKRRRLEAVEQELKEIDERIEMYRQDLELDAMLHEESVELHGLDFALSME